MDHVSKSMNDIQPFFPFINVRSILECQIPTQRYGRRPFGVGFLMAGYDVWLIHWISLFSISFLS